MDRAQVKELHYITAISNLASILEHGILSHRKADRLPHHSVAMEEVQELRKKKVVPGGRPLHDYVNLYFCARNPMLSKLRGQNKELCVLAIDLTVLDLPEVVLTDQNAGSRYVGFWPSPAGLDRLDYDMIFAESWIDPHQIIYWRKKAAKCAEVLVPDVVPPEYITGIYVSCRQSAESVRGLVGAHLPVHIDEKKRLFFS